MKDQFNFETSSLALSNERGKTDYNPQDIRRMQQTLNRTLGL